MYCFLPVSTQHFVAQLSATLRVEGVSGTERDDTTLYAAAEQRHVADEIEQLVARRLVLVVEG